MKHQFRRTAVFVLLVAAITGGGRAAMAQQGDWLAPEIAFPVHSDSGEVSNFGDQASTLLAQPVSAPGANWVRVSLEGTVLPVTSEGGRTLLRLTSALDGAYQLLDADSLAQWRHTSAYFNGDTVLVELIAPPGAAGCRLVIPELRRDVEAVAPRNTCGGVDDRMASSDPRSARILPIGCTGWLIRDTNFCFLTAGHCASGNGSGMTVMEFNVPLSNSNGTIVHPAPWDQYATDLTSLQVVTGGIAIGNDWAYYGVFQNSTSGRTAYEAQQSAFTLTTTPVVAMGQTLRKTGFGTTDPPVSNTLNQAQKTLTGPISAIEGNAFRYVIDSSGGDSGSPVFDETTGIAVAIHTNGGCTSVGYNSGCSVLHPGLQTALANPRGVCVPKYFDVTFPTGRPQTVNALGGTELVVSVVGRNGYEENPVAGELRFDAGAGEVAVQLAPIGGSLFRAVFPPIPCATAIRYYLKLEPTTGGVQLVPAGYPVDQYFTYAAGSVNPIASYDFETAGGWTVQNIGVAGGAWERGIPAGDGTRGDPTRDFDGSGQCFLTGNAPGDSDVDGGPTRLWSPAFNLTAASRPIITYARWFSNDNLDADRLLVEISNNFGATWTPVESVADLDGWQKQFVDVSTFVSLSSVVRIRFGVADEPNNSLTEAAIDAVSVFDLICPGPGECRKGDVNSDGKVNGADLQAFTAQLTGGGTPGSWSACAADIDNNGTVDLLDAAMIIDCVMAGGCP